MLKSAAIFKRLTKNVVCILYRFKHTHSPAHTHRHWQGAHCVGGRKFICHCGYFSVFFFVVLFSLFCFCCCFLGAQHFCPSVFFFCEPHTHIFHEVTKTFLTQRHVPAPASSPTPLLAKPARNSLYSF